MSLLEPPTCARAMMDYTAWYETNSAWKSGAGICSCSLMPEGTGSRFYTGMAPAFGAAPRQTLHNARKGYLRVLYPYHPYHGQTFEAFGSNGGLRDLVYIRMSNNATRGIPAWMFDQAICSRVRCADRPAIDCHALLRLAGLLDLEVEARGIGGHESSIAQPKNTSRASLLPDDAGTGEAASECANGK